MSAFGAILVRGALISFLPCRCRTRIRLLFGVEPDRGARKYCIIISRCAPLIYVKIVLADVRSGVKKADFLGMSAYDLPNGHAAVVARCPLIYGAGCLLRPHGFTGGPCGVDRGEIPRLVRLRRRRRARDRPGPHARRHIALLVYGGDRIVVLALLFPVSPLGDPARRRYDLGAHRLRAVPARISTAATLRRACSPTFAVGASCPKAAYFAALEQPELLADEVRAFFRELRERRERDARKGCVSKAAEAANLAAFPGFPATPRRGSKAGLCPSREQPPVEFSCHGQKWSLRFLSCKSLIPFENSLFFKIFSLLICVGNCFRSGCSAAVSCTKSCSRSPKIANFPVKFPVSREFAWRRVRSALRRQGGSSALNARSIALFMSFPILGNAKDFLASGGRGEAAKDGMEPGVPKRKMLACVCGKDRHRYRVVIGLECAFEAVFPHFWQCTYFPDRQLLRNRASQEAFEQRKMPLLP